MDKLTKAVLTGAAVVGLMAGGYGVASAAGGDSSLRTEADDSSNEADDSDAPLVGSDLDRAVAAALEHTGGGEVTETETGDDGAAFGVEVRLADGSQIEVNLDADFNVIGSEADDD